MPRRVISISIERFVREHWWKNSCIKIEEQRRKKAVEKFQAGFSLKKQYPKASSSHGAVFNSSCDDGKNKIKQMAQLQTVSDMIKSLK